MICTIDFSIFTVMQVDEVGVFECSAGTSRCGISSSSTKAKRMGDRSDKLCGEDTLIRNYNITNESHEKAEVPW
ncbi:hypothetical protein D3C77_688960 [compost metagenome]